MVLLPLNSNPNYLADRLLEALQSSQNELGLDALKHLEKTASTILAFVRSNINFHASIHSLPAEVLGMIFQHALPSRGDGMPFTGYEDPGLMEELRARVALTHVCRRWRRVALDMASLWTIIDEFSSASTTEFLARSGEMPIQVCIRNFLGRSVGGSLRPHESRVRDLYLNIAKGHRSVIPSSFPELPFDPVHLERLSIVTDARPFDESRPNIDLEVSPVLFGQPTPRLTKLILRNMCWLPVISCETLTHLHISQGTPISLDTLLMFIGRCTALERLVLVDIYIANSTAVPLDHAVSLPHLRTLVLGINQSHLSMRRLIQYLVLPPTVTVRVTGVYAFRALSDLRPFPKLPFTETFDTLSVDHAFGRLVVRAFGPSSALLLDFKDYPLSSADQAVDFMKAVIPFENIADVRYRAHVLHARRAVHLLGDMPMPALKRFAYVDTNEGSAIPDAWADRREAYMTAISQALARAPRLAELELWLVFHYRGKTEEMPDLADAVKAQVEDVVVRSCACEPPLRIPAVDADRHIYEW
ncbi:hypothetical protein C8Q80DRAFT_1121088 [Daedaleopsis nitida]|nr:hypothetical protein C8Q80DRAFT_1121088 [Daedaleopsis nitida]